MITVQVIGREALAAKFAASLKTMEASKPVTLRKIGMAQQWSIRDEILNTFENRTWNLFKSVRVFGQTKNGISVGTGKGTDYVRPLEFGSIPHRITAGFSTQGVFGGDVGHYRFISVGGAGALHFIDSAGEERFAKYVNHPGNRPYRFVYSGFMRSVPQVYRHCCDMIAAAFGIPMR
jgi:hypothetical protein